MKLQKKIGPIKDVLKVSKKEEREIRDAFKSDQRSKRRGFCMMKILRDFELRKG